MWLVPYGSNVAYSTLEDINERLQRLERQELLVIDASVGRASDNLRLGISPSPVARNVATSHPRQQSLLTPAFTPGTNVDGDQTVFSAPSNNSFIQQLTSIISTAPDTETTSNSVHAPLNALGYAESQPSTADYDLNDLRLPPRPLADSLLRCYWDLFHPLFPILHQPSFEAEYQQVWEPTTASSLHNKSAKEIVYYSTLNIVLALGSQRSEEIPERERAILSDDLFKRSARLVSLDTLSYTSLAVVQLLFLRGTYLLYTTFADRCWNTVGVAIRAAQALGLHISREATNKVDQLTGEMCRRVWCGCIHLDWYDFHSILINLITSADLTDSSIG